MTTTTNTNTTPAADLASLEQQLKQAKAKATEKGRETLRQIGGRCPKGQTLVGIGSAATALEAIGFSCTVTTVEQLFETLETARDLASTPLVQDKNIPAAWLRTDNGLPLGNNGLSAIAQAIETAEALSIDWRTWLSESTAVQVTLEVLPDLQTKLEAKRVENKKAEELKRAEANKPAHVRAFEAAVTELAKMRATFAGMPKQKTSEGDKLRKQIVALAGKIVRGPEAFKVDVRPQQESKPATPQRGDIVRKPGDETLYVVGRNNETFELMTARVADDLGAIRKEIAKRTGSKPLVKDISLEMLALICLDPEVAARVIQTETISVTEAMELIKTTVEEYQARKDAEPKPGDLYLDNKGIETHVCDGKYGRCAKHYPSSDSILPVSLGFIAEQAGCNKYELTREKAIKACGRCPECGGKQYEKGNQTVEKFEAAMVKLYEEPTGPTKQKNATIALGGASGDYANPKRPASYQQKKADKRAKEAERLKSLGRTNGRKG